jgi:hypothetical protein
VLRLLHLLTHPITMPKATTFTVGDRVAHSVKFLRSICDYSKDSADRRGTVQSIVDYKLAFPVLKVLWDDQPRDEEPQGGLSCNFTLVSRLAIDAALAS